MGKPSLARGTNKGLSLCRSHSTNKMFTWRLMRETVCAFQKKEIGKLSLSSTISWVFSLNTEFRITTITHVHMDLVAAPQGVGLKSILPPSVPYHANSDRHLTRQCTVFTHNSGLCTPGSWTQVHTATVHSVPYHTATNTVPHLKSP